ncbi:MAG: TM2 domain-containing protein [Proteobacteria bacterium]|nr:TM2 domain-containing protein [Pseudomonadota bacterium]
MSGKKEENQEVILDKIRERVLEREREIRKKEDKEAGIQATLQALEEITEVPRAEMERIADEIRASYEQPQDTKTGSLPVVSTGTDDLPATVREALSKLPSILKEEFMEEYRIQYRHVGVSYLLWLIPPPFSCHYLYMRRRFLQVLYFLTCGGVFVWWLADLFRMPQLIQEDNRKTARKILKKMLRHSLSRKNLK